MYVETVIKRKNIEKGQWFWYKVSYARILERNGKGNIAIGACIDVTAEIEENLLYKKLMETPLLSEGELASSMLLDRKSVV